MAIGAAVTGLVLAIVGGLDRDTQASLPPVRETQLVRAVKQGSCELRRVRGGERLRPPVDGPGDRTGSASADLRRGAARRPARRPRCGQG